MHLFQVRLMVEVFNLRTNELLGQGCSQPICDSSSKVKLSEFSCKSFLFTCPAKILTLSFLTFPPKKEHGALVFHTAFPLRCCAKGGRKVFPPHIFPPSPCFYLFLCLRCSWCVTAPWPRTWSLGSRSTTKEGIWRIKTIFSSSQGWQADNRWRRFPFS